MCSFYFCDCDEISQPKQLRGKMIYFNLQFRAQSCLQSHHCSRSLKQPSRSHLNEEQREINVCVLTFLLACAQFDVSVLKQFRNVCLENGAPCSGLCLPTSFTLIEMIFPWTCLQCQSIVDSPLVRLSPKVTLYYVKLMIETDHHRQLKTYSCSNPHFCSQRQVPMDNLGFHFLSPLGGEGHLSP